MALYLGKSPVVVNVDGDCLSLPSPDTSNCLMLVSLTPFEISVDTPGWDGVLYYSTDRKTWDEWDGAALSGSKVYCFRGVGNTKIVGSNGGCIWTIASDISNLLCIGNIENLLDYKLVIAGKHPPMAEYAFLGMFENCTSLTHAPELPATDLAFCCYQSMFKNCTSLTHAPELPATRMESGCYRYMFSGCTSLIDPPELPATSLAHGCYHNMFENCTSLTHAPELPATDIEQTCYSYMFLGCTSLIDPPELPATELKTSCYEGMFRGCSSLIRAPELPATNLMYDCYEEMFCKCTSLTQIPSLPSTELRYGCYEKMFIGATAIKISSTLTDEYTQPYRIPTVGVGTILNEEKYALYRMFVETGGTFQDTPDINTTYYVHKDIEIV